MKKTFCSLMLSCFAMAVLMPAFAAGKPCLTRSQTVLEKVSHFEKPNARPSKSATVNIRNIPSGDSVYSELLIIAQVTGTFSSVKYQIDTGAENSMVRVGTTDRYQATWTIGVSPGPHTLYVRAKDSSGRVVGTASVGVTVVADFIYELYCEIDYMSGHVPPTSVLSYIENYWKGHAIKFNYMLGDIVADPTPSDGYISDNDFWTLEKSCNDYWMYDDRAYGGVSPQFYLKEKWMLYGTRYQSSNVGGYTYVDIANRDLLAGNYMFIADSMIDQWEAANGIAYDGGEVIVTAHEVGHSIGIAKLSTLGYEVYDSDYYSIMSNMRVQNGKYMSRYWYYSKEYWATANLGYYTI